MLAARKSMSLSVEARIEKGACSAPLKVLETWLSAKSVSDLISCLKALTTEE